MSAIMGVEKKMKESNWKINWKNIYHKSSITASDILYQYYILRTYISITTVLELDVAKLIVHCRLSPIISCSYMRMCFGLFWYDPSNVKPIFRTSWRYWRFWAGDTSYPTTSRSTGTTRPASNWRLWRCSTTKGAIFL
jgi:hypothetical protein